MEPGYKVRSKPEYQELRWNPAAQLHLVVASGEGGMAVVKMYQAEHPRRPVKVFYLPEDGGRDYLPALKHAAGDAIQSYRDENALLQAFYGCLAQSRMGTQIYMSGPENFMWAGVKLARQFGVQEDDVMKNLAGTLARPVFCVHCKTITPAVSTNIAPCNGCGRYLFVRDHFSRLHGAYMGFMVDAEAPGERPEIEEIYP